MFTAVATGLLMGMAFGAVLYKVGATRYSRVMGMLTLRDTKIMKFAFMAIATASVLYGLFGVFGVAEDWGVVPRVMPYLGPAHLVGGLFFGLAMGTTGLCPGTCVARTGGRAGDTKFTGWASVLGLLVGILLYNGLKGWLVEVGVIAGQQKPVTLYGWLGIPYEALALVFGAAVMLITFAVDRATPEKSYAPVHERKTLLDWVRGEWSWAWSGAIAGTLVVWASAQDGYLGFSGAALAAVGWAADALSFTLESVPVINESIAWRAALLVGVLPGGFIASLVSLKSEAAAHATVHKHWDGKALARYFGAGTSMAFGAMVGGGCTTGAFIAAWPTLSVGSFLMAGTFFVVSVVVSNARMLTHRFDLPQVQLVGDKVYD